MGRRKALWEAPGARAAGRPLLLAGLAHRGFEGVGAERDELLHPDEVTSLVASSAGRRRLVRVAGASHLFTEDLVTPEREAQAAFVWLLEGAA